MTHPKYATPAGYRAAADYVTQGVDPKQHSKPDPKLLLVEPEHGPITRVELETIDGELQVAASFNGRNPRYLDPLDYCAITLGTAFGMGLNLNDTGQGLTYPKLRVAGPKNAAIHVLRILTDAQPREVAKQHPHEGHRPDYHHLSRRGLSKHSVQKFWNEDKPSRVPRAGRKEFYAAVEWYWHRNHLKSGLTVSFEDHLRFVRLALEAGDRI